MVPNAEIESRVVSRMTVPREMRLADCTNPRVRAFDISAEIHSIGDRTMTQAWAAAFYAAGFDGVRYFARHDPAQRLTGIALFGPAGEVSWPRAAPEPISGDLVERVETTFGIRVS